MVIFLVSSQKNGFLVKKRAHSGFREVRGMTRQNVTTGTKNSTTNKRLVERRQQLHIKQKFKHSLEEKNVKTRLQHHGQMKKEPVKQEKKLHNKFQKTFERRNRATEKSVSTVYWVSTV